MSESKEHINSAQRKLQLDALREMLYNSFPPTVYNGAITYADEHAPSPWPEELDDDEDLFRTLKGKRWIDISMDMFNEPPNLGLRGGGNLCLLTDEAFVAFLPAWLLFSLEHQDGENLARHFLAYSFESSAQNHTGSLRLLNPSQRETLRSFLKDIEKYEVSEFVRKSATKALEIFDNVTKSL